MAGRPVRETRREPGRQRQRQGRDPQGQERRQAGRGRRAEAAEGQPPDPGIEQVRERRRRHPLGAGALQVGELARHPGEPGKEESEGGGVRRHRGGERAEPAPAAQREAGPDQAEAGEDQPGEQVGPEGEGRGRRVEAPAADLPARRAFAGGLEKQQEADGQARRGEAVAPGVLGHLGEPGRPRHRPGDQGAGDRFEAPAADRPGRTGGEHPEGDVQGPGPEDPGLDAQRPAGGEPGPQAQVVERRVGVVGGQAVDGGGRPLDQEEGVGLVHPERALEARPPELGRQQDGEQEEESEHGAGRAIHRAACYSRPPVARRNIWISAF